MAKLLVAASILWPVLLTGGWWARAHEGPAWLSVGTYLVAGRVCHQKPERSFHTSGVQWPVCGRCAGLYLAAPAGALAALAFWRRKAVPSLTWLAAAAVPTAATVGAEYLGLTPVSSIARAVAALPLGLAVAFFLVSVAGSETAAPKQDRAIG